MKPGRRLAWAGALAVLAFMPGGVRTAAAAESLASARPAALVDLALPAYLVPARDAAFGTAFTRVTQPGAALGGGIVCGPERCRHRYSSAQAWNADQSLLVIVAGCNGLCFLDGRTYQPLFRRSRSGECEWHPVDPGQMICVTGRTISLWAPTTSREQVLYAADGDSNLQFGPYKGNPSDDGRRIAVRALSAAGQQIVFGFDLVSRHRFPSIAISELPGRNDSCSISPLGRYIACFQGLPEGIDQAFIFSVDGALVQSWTEHHRPGHGDMAVDADGSEVYVGISKAAPDKYQVIKRRLADGVVTSLAPYGEAQHASLRALKRPGWVFLTYGGDPAEVAQHARWAPFAREIVALKIDGSGETRRIVQTHNAPHDYWNESQASPSPDGTQVIWSSNWGQPGGPVYDFVARLDWPQEAASR